MVRAMVMAAGAGTRLRPLTVDVPKPMVPIANRPVMEYTIENLKRHGITDIVLNLHHHPELIKKHFSDGRQWGVRISYSHEPKLMGTAGGVRQASAFFQKETFVVTSGDGLTDIDFTDLISFHKRKHAIATMALKKMTARFDYGVTLTRAGGRIQKFVEKPYWGDVFSDQVNTGIYVCEPSILSAIPARRVYDFGHDVWPALLSQKKPIYGRLTERYWCDVGNIAEYQKAQLNFLEGHLLFKLPGRQIRRGIWVEEGASIEPGVRLEGPCLIGRRAHISRGAHIGPYAVIGHGSRVGARSSLRHCTLWDHVHVAPHVHLEGCVMGHNTVVKENISVFGGILLATS